MILPSIYEANLRNNSVVQMPAYHTYIYLLVLSPQGFLKEKIINIKDSFAKNYSHPFARSTKPHVTLSQFMQRGLAEEKIVARLKTIAKAQPPINIHLKDFGSFPSHTIYINVTSKVPLMNLSKTLREAQSLLKYAPGDKPFFLTEPHLTIARKLAPWQHEKAWIEYSNSSFTGRFIADKMTLLKRKVDHNRYEHVADFQFQSEPLEAVQGSLFG
ncbi:2'-5' RNA ligase family protein [Ilyomonas limi]|nr:2'-5' RNA ligase family protein [Ilyomonas limi]